MQPKEAHLDFLDRLRGVAILGVFLFHCHGLAYNWDFDLRDAVTLEQKVLFPFNLGSLGVALFFVISGFCIHLSHQRSSRKDFTTFFTRRFFRIYPPYLVALLLFSFVNPWHVVHLGNRASLIQFFTHLFLVHNFNPRTYFEINGTFWSIAVEIQLYLLYPLLLFLARTFSWKTALLVTLALEVATRLYLGYATAIAHTDPIGWIAGSPLGYWFSWSIGAAAAESWLKGEAPPLARVPVWVPILLVPCCAIHRVVGEFAFLFSALISVCVINRMLKATSAGTTSPPSWIGRHLRFAGVVSYSIYLLHLPILSKLSGILSGAGVHPFTKFLLLDACWFPALLISWLFYRALEIPSNNLGKQLTRRPKVG